jgi:phosphohistidine phosphatase SixA
MVKKIALWFGVSLIPLMLILVSHGYAKNDLWAQLKIDDTVLIMRHALAPGTGDPANFRLGDCRTQRNLSEEGREQARTIGRELKERQLKVKKVLSSQWCRCLETAKLLGLGSVQPEPILNSFFQDRSTASTQTEALRQLIHSQRSQGGVLVMVTHQVNITALTDIFPSSGGIVVVRATAGGEIEIKGELKIAPPT